MVVAGCPLVSVASLALLAGACADEATSPPDARGLSARYPGPCGSSHQDSNGSTRCDASYDDAGRMTATSCTQTPVGSLAEPINSTTTRTYDGDQLATWTRRQTEPGGGGISTYGWTFAATEIIEDERHRGYAAMCEGHDVRTHEATGLVFTGHPVDLAFWWRADHLAAPDALVRDLRGCILPVELPPEKMVIHSDVTYSFDGPPRTGTRTRTGSDGSTRAFVYDAAGRMLEDRGEVVTTYEYEGDDLVAVRQGNGVVEYQHDRHGNLLRKVRTGGVTTTFDYGCW